VIAAACRLWAWAAECLQRLAEERATAEPATVVTSAVPCDGTPAAAGGDSATKLASLGEAKAVLLRTRQLLIAKKSGGLGP
jgi:hypothetical protein